MSMKLEKFSIDSKLIFEVFFAVLMVLLQVMKLQMLKRLEKINLMILLLTRIMLTNIFCVHLVTF